MITSFQKILGCFGMRRCAAALALATAAVVGSGVAGCSKEDTPAGSRVGETVLVRLPGVSVAAPVEVVPGAWGASAGGAVPRGIVPQDAAPCAAAPDAAPDGGLASADDAGELFSVTLGALPAADAATERGTAGTAGTAGSAGTAAAGTSSAPATRADAELTNVWVFQFDAAGKAVQCRKVDALAAGRPLEVRLNSGESFTIGVVANGPASGLSTETVPDLAAFREGLLFTSAVTSFEEVPYAGTLDGVRVLANGQVQVGGSGANVPVITLRRCMAQVTVALTHNVTDYALDGVELYSVPVGAAFAPDRTAAVSPAAADANFGFRDNAAAGLAPHVQSTAGGTGRSYTWYIGQNRRGSGTGIVKVQDKNASKAPAYATYARVKTHSTTAADAPLYYDIYLGEDMFSDFNVTANHVYSYTTRIVGSAAAHFSLIDTDGRVSGKKPLYVASATVTPAGDIPAEGKAYSLTLTGLLPDEGVQVRAQSGGTALATGKVTASGTAVSLAVPANASYTSRTVAFEYLWNGTWTKIGDSRTQAGYSVSNATHNAPSTIPGQGGSYNVTLTGYLPSNVAVRAQSGGTAIVSGTVTKSGTAVLLTVPGNLSYNNRSVTFEYNWNGTWTKIGAACSQQGWNVTKASVSPAGDIPAAGGTYTVTLTGWGGYQVRAMSGSAQLVIKTDFTQVANYSATIEIPANPSTESSRTVTFQYRYNGKWADIDSRTQTARPSVKTWSQCNTRCESRGGLPSRAELKAKNWAGWAAWEERNAWWTREQYRPNLHWSVLYDSNFSVAADRVAWTDDYELGCRCLNE
ncbi:hypothetical protein [Alistipes timonensis]|uniref:DUF4906 domain-containing protein n=1 Tax=Alistipes timonensis TaxID=1465754 RepID=UPI00266FCF14|nr:hypothetical protein [Alistipes timonensis]